MMLGDGALGFREFTMGEPVPLATIHAAVLELLRGRDDVVLYGALAVNAYVDEPRMTQDVDVMTVRAAEIAEEIRAHLAGRFTIATRVRSVREGLGHRVYQLQKPKNRHLVDVRHVDRLPPHRRIEGLLVLEPVELVCAKVIGMVARARTAKGATDLADLRRLLLAFPQLKAAAGEVADRLGAASAGPSALAAWRTLADEEIEPDADDDV